MKKYLSLICFILFFILVITSNIIYSRYVLRKNNYVNFTSAPFYFTADIGNSESILNYEDSNIQIVLKNNDNMEFNKFDITYEIMLENSKFTLCVDGEESIDNKIVKTLEGGSLLEKSIDIRFETVKNNIFNNEENINLILKSTKPYQKEINIPITITHDYNGGLYIDKNDDKAIVPAEFTVSKAENEKTIENGLVIYLLDDKTQTEIQNIDWSNQEILNDLQEDYDQFVWIPVENPVAENETQQNTLIADGKYPMALKIDGTDNNGKQNYRGILYDFALSSNGTQVNVTPITYSSTGYREPAYLTHSTNGDANSSNNNVGINSNLLQEQFNAMVEKVKTNKGFWIGRYETSNMSSDKSKDSTNQVKVIKGTQTGVNEMNFYRMYAQQKNYSKLVLGTTTEITSSMIWGSQWDQILIWMKNVKNEIKNSYYVVNSIGMANHKSDFGGTGKLQNTGYYSVKNVYDLAGNVAERTLEAYDTHTRVFRGGSHVTNNSNNTMPSYRNTSYYPAKVGDNCGARLTIF